MANPGPSAGQRVGRELTGAKFYTGQNLLMAENISSHYEKSMQQTKGILHSYVTCLN